MFAMKEKNLFWLWASQVSIEDGVLKGIQEIVKWTECDLVKLVRNGFQMWERVNCRERKPYYVVLIMISLELKERQKRIVSIADRKS